MCSGALHLVGTIPSGCTQVVLSPCRSAVSFTTTTVTVGSGTARTVTSAPAGTQITGAGLVEVIVPSSCSASPGIEYTNRPNPATGGSTPSNPYYPAFSPAVYNNPQGTYSTVNFQGIADNIGIGIASPGVGTVYNSGTHAMAQTAMIFRGYFYAPTGGSWTFTLHQPDDVGLVIPFAPSWMRSKTLM